MIHKLAHRESPFDSEAKIFNNSKSGFIKLASTVGGDYELPEYTPISNQGILGSCSANSCVDSLEILMGIQDKNSVKQLSRLFVYYNARNMNLEVDKDEGSYISFCFKSLSTLGICEEQTWAYDVNKVFAQPSLWAYQEANDNKINNYYRIFEDQTKLDNIELAIRSGHPVVFGTSISDEFQSCGHFNEYPIFNFPKLSVGNHALICVGIKYINGKRYFKIRNSWGNSWAFNGYCLFTDDYMNNAGTNDLWVPTLIPDII